MLSKDPIKAEIFKQKARERRKGKTYEEIFGVEKAKELRELRKEQMRGEMHWNWKGGRSEQWYRKVMAKSQIPVICIECESIDRVHIHHKDKNHHNNQIENLEFLCAKCHKKKHPQVSCWKGKIPPCAGWNKSLTKETDERVEKYAKALRGKKHDYPTWWVKKGYKSAREAIIAQRGYFNK